MLLRPSRSTLFPYTRSSDLPRNILRFIKTVSLFRSMRVRLGYRLRHRNARQHLRARGCIVDKCRHDGRALRSEEHTSELQSQSNLVCRLLLEKKNEKTTNIT